MAMAVVPKTVSAIDDENLETFSLVWLDARVNSDNHNIAAQKLLRDTINHLKTFDNANDCRKYITQMSPDHYLVFIVSGGLGQVEVPRIHNIGLVSGIYVYCMNRELHKQWANKFSKVRYLTREHSKLSE
jgi:hypothetical protein